MSDYRGAERREISHNTILYSYPCGAMDIICSTRYDDFLEPGWELADRAAESRLTAPPAPREAGKKSEGDDMLRSMRRAKANIRRLALSNSFEWFVTLTLDQVKIDRYDGQAITRALGTWCDNMVRRHGLRYILVPELHKDGAFHFHGFMAGGGLEAVASGHYSGGKEVFNLPQWGYGFSAAIRLYGEYPAAVSYVCKYIGKQADGAALAGLPKGRLWGRWYFSGGDLAKPEKVLADMDYQEVKSQYGKGGVELPLPGKSIYVVHLSAPSGGGGDKKQNSTHGREDSTVSRENSTMGREEISYEKCTRPGNNGL